MIPLYVKIEDSQKKTTHLLLETWGKILEMPTNLIKVNDEDGIWRGNVVNKSFIVNAEPDYEYSTQKRKNYLLNKAKNESVTEEEKEEYRTIMRDIYFLRDGMTPLGKPFSEENARKLSTTNNLLN